jgi:transcriptional regulator with XRE-family HTH domain
VVKLPPEQEPRWLATPRSHKRQIRAHLDDVPVASRDGVEDRAARRARALVARTVGDIRGGRVSAGLSQASVAHRLGISRSRLSRIELGLESRVPAELLVRYAASVGFDLAVRAYPAGDLGLDRAQRRLIRRLMDRLGPDWTWRFEVPLPIPGDARAFDAVGRHRVTGLIIYVEAETRLEDIQAVLRRITIKCRDGSVTRLIVLVSDTRHNREIVHAAAPELAAMFAAGSRRTLARLIAGLDPGADALILL